MSTASMATGQNPSVSIGRGPANPPPVPSYGDKWVKRIYSAVKAATPGNAASFLQSSFAIPGDYFVDKVQVWNLSVTSPTGVAATLNQGLLTDLGTNDIIGNDFGSATSLASVTFKIPVGHAKAVSPIGTGVVVSCNAVFPLTGAAENYAAHIHVWVPI